jgi:hypothetical protein
VQRRLLLLLLLLLLLTELCPGAYKAVVKASAKQ